MGTTTTGRQAEQAAADYLTKQGYKILDTNWRTRWCEIDLVAEKSKTIYFVEVKYRKSSQWGGGLDYITPKKLRQMRFAANFWVSEHGWSGACQLAAIEISGPDFEVAQFLPNLT